jgi:GMP reductase
MKQRGLYASISLGVKKPDYETVDRLVALGLVTQSTSPSTSPMATPTA